MYEKKNIFQFHVQSKKRFETPFQLLYLEILNYHQAYVNLNRICGKLKGLSKYGSF